MSRRRAATAERSRAWEATRVVALLAFGVFFLVPLLSMVDFSTKVIGAEGRTLQPWKNLLTDETVRSSIVTSLLLSLFTVALMLVLLVPTMIWVRLRVPGATRLVEFLCLLPLTVPPLVIVVGIANVYAWVSYLLGDSALTLTFATSCWCCPTPTARSTRRSRPSTSPRSRRQRDLSAPAGARSSSGSCCRTSGPA